MATQEQLLLSLVQGAGGKVWAADRIGWKTSSKEQVCSWDGVECDANDSTKVVSIRLPLSDFSATLPSELGQLTFLKTIVLPKNIIEGTIPVQIADLPNLEYIDLSNNKLSGPIPRFASPALRHIDLSYNMLQGSLPSDIGFLHQSMANFKVMKNQVTGTIPVSFHAMSNLTTLWLSENLLSGTIPKVLGNSSYMKQLFLDNNKLVGLIHPSLALAQDTLQEIWLQDNMLSGTIPVALAELDKLQSLFLDGNKFTGTVPSELCSPALNVDFFSNIPDTQQRDLCDSIACPVNMVAFEGVYPCSQCASKYYNPYLGRTGKCIDLNQRSILEKLYTSTTVGGPWNGENNWNNTSTDICDFSGVRCDKTNHVTGISLKGRGLKGTVPDEIGFLNHLGILDLSDNELYGFLPSDLRWAPLTSLDISGNKLKGIVPPMLCLDSDVNGNGDNGDYNCENIACPVGTYSNTGRNVNVSETCMPCDLESARFLASKTCISLSQSDSSNPVYANDGGLTAGAIIAMTIILFLCLAATVCFIAKKRNLFEARHSHEIVGLTDDAVIEGGLRRNPLGISSLPFDNDDVNSIASDKTPKTGVYGRFSRNLNGVSSLPYEDDAISTNSDKTEQMSGSFNHLQVAAYRELMNMPPPAEPLMTFSDAEGDDDGRQSDNNNNSSGRRKRQKSKALLRSSSNNEPGEKGNIPSTNVERPGIHKQQSSRRAVRKEKRRGSDEAVFVHPVTLEVSSSLLGEENEECQNNSTKDSSKEVWLDVPAI